MHWAIILRLVVSFVTLIVAAIGTWFTFLNHRARKQNELPRIQLYETAGVYHFRLETDHHSVGWKVIRIEVVDSDHGKEVLGQTLYKKEERDQGVTISSYLSDWRDFCEYPEGARLLTDVYFHNRCYEASLSFVCETPSKVLWNPRQRRKRRVPYKYIRGTHPSGDNDPYLRSLS